MASSHAYKVTKCRANYLQIYFNHIILSESSNLLLFWDLYLTYNLHNADIGIYSNRDLVLLPALLPFMIWCVLSFTLHMETFSWHSRSLPHKQTPKIAKSTATTKSKKKFSSGEKEKTERTPGRTRVAAEEWSGSFTPLPSTSLGRQTRFTVSPRFYDKHAITFLSVGKGGQSGYIPQVITSLQPKVY